MSALAHDAEEIKRKEMGDGGGVDLKRKRNNGENRGSRRRNLMKSAPDVTHVNG